MMDIRKFQRLPGRSRLRKAVLLLTEIQTGLMAGRPADADSALALGIARTLETSPDTEPHTRSACRVLLDFSSENRTGGHASRSTGGHAGADPGFLRALDNLRHLLIADSGQSPADWDLIDPATGKLGTPAGTPSSGMRIYCEDIRSPFNLGAIFRSADAFGVRELILSPECADPSHPRCARSSMGATESIPHRRAGIDALAEAGPVFALELGGPSLAGFDFPETGTVVLGSEELGVSSEALARCDLGRVTIPMSGAKASLNVAVAAGILLNAWRQNSEERRKIRATPPISL